MSNKSKKSIRSVRSFEPKPSIENCYWRPPALQLFSSFCFRFLALCCLSFLLTVMAPPAWLEPLNQWTAKLTATLLVICGLEPQVHGTLMSVHGFAVRIILECTPLYSLLLFVSFVLAYPANSKARLKGLFLGGTFLVLFNAIRVAALILIGWKKPSLFDWVHAYLGQVAIIICVVAVCVIWIRYGTEPQVQGERWFFFIRFAAISGILFLVWAEFNRSYIGVGDVLIREVFSWWGYRLAMPLGHTLYYHTFKVVTFAALLLATASIELRKRIQWLIAGLAVLVVLHLAVRVCNVLVTGLRVESVLIISSLATVIAQYLVPFLLWVWIVKSQTTRRQFNLADSR